MATQEKLEENREIEVAKNAISKILGKIKNSIDTKTKLRVSAEDIQNSKRYLNKFKKSKNNGLLYTAGVIFWCFALDYLFLSQAEDFTENIIFLFFSALLMVGVFVFRDYEKSYKNYISILVGNLSQYRGEEKRIIDKLNYIIFGIKRFEFLYTKIMFFVLFSFACILMMWYFVTNGLYDNANKTEQVLFLFWVLMSFFKYIKEYDKKGGEVR